jgi:hypothetical protein
VARGHTETTSFFVTLPLGAFASGEPAIEVRVTDGAGFDERYSWRVLGPTPRHDDDRDADERRPGAGS